jgi:hypothetical protein
MDARTGYAIAVASRLAIERGRDHLHGRVCRQCLDILVEDVHAALLAYDLHAEATDNTGLVCFKGEVCACSGECGRGPLEGYSCDCVPLVEAQTTTVCRTCRAEMRRIDYDSSAVIQPPRSP